MFIFFGHVWRLAQKLCLFASIGEERRLVGLSSFISMGSNPAQANFQLDFPERSFKLNIVDLLVELSFPANSGCLPSKNSKTGLPQLEF